MEGENGSERENKCKLTPRYEKTPGSRVPREEKPGRHSLVLLSQHIEILVQAHNGETFCTYVNQRASSKSFHGGVLDKMQQTEVTEQP